MNNVVKALKQQLVAESFVNELQNMALNVETLNSLTCNYTQHVNQDEEFLFQVRHYFLSSDAL